MTRRVRRWVAAAVAVAATGLMVGRAIAATTGVNQSWSRGFSKPIRTVGVSGPGSVRGHLMITGTASGPTLAELSDEERYERFDRLQEKMLGVWEIMRQNEEDESVVVIPSVSVDRVNERSGSLQQAYEERLLVLLLLLRQPRLRIIYVTSMPIAQRSWSTTSRCSQR